MEVKKIVFQRVPPGDRWEHILDNVKLFESLTDALEYHYQQTGCRQYYIDAGNGVIYAVSHEPDPVVEPQTYSIYGDYNV